MADADLIKKIRDHLGKARSNALMLSQAQSAERRTDYLKRLTDELKQANALLDKLER